MQTQNPNRQLQLLWPFLAGFFLLWSGWAYLLARYPDLTQSGVLRATVRILLWVIPAYVFVWKTEQRSVIDALCLRDHQRQGVLIGLLGFAVLFVISWLRYRSRIFDLTLPADLSTWLNPILTAPLAEEIVFRGVVLRVLLTRLNAIWSLSISAALFALIHVPYWSMTSAHVGIDLLILLGSIFVLGIWFGLLFLRSNSLWAPLICHTLNNLLSISAGI